MHCTEDEVNVVVIGTVEPPEFVDVMLLVAVAVEGVAVTPIVVWLDVVAIFCNFNY